MIWSIIKFFGSLTLGVFFSFTIISYYIYDKEKHNEETNKETPFEDLYKTELQELQTTVHDENKKVDCINFEYKSMEFPSPYGTVYMKVRDIIQNDYEVIKTSNSNENSETESMVIKPVFMYYAKTSYIPYKYLDTLCRRYVIDYNIVSLYNVNYSGYEADVEETDIEDHGDNEDNEDDTNKESSMEKRDSVFANLKTQVTKSKKSIITKDINTFKYMGNLVDYEKNKNKKTMINENKDEENPEEDKISYKDFLKRQRNIENNDNKDKKD